MPIDWNQLYQAGMEYVKAGNLEEAGQLLQRYQAVLFTSEGLTLIRSSVEDVKQRVNDPAAREDFDTLYRLLANANKFGITAALDRELHSRAERLQAVNEFVMARFYKEEAVLNRYSRILLDPATIRRIERMDNGLPAASSELLKIRVHLLNNARTMGTKHDFGREQLPCTYGFGDLADHVLPQFLTRHRQIQW
jgi:hypothetical protein